ncbi:MAG: S1C family serine protease, partial [Terriglobia bacterium]
VALVLVGEGQGRLARSGSALVVREDGVLLTAYHLIKGARRVQVRLHNGETYDQVQLVGVDERRDVAALRILASGLKVLPVAGADEVKVGDAVFVISNPVLLGWTASNGILSGARLADDIPGAGKGYRLLQFTAPVSPGSSGGALVDAKGRALGIIVGAAPGQNNNFAVPLESVVGLTGSGKGSAFDSGEELFLPTEHRVSPPPELPEPGTTPADLLQAARTIYIETHDRWHFPTQTLAAALLRQQSLHERGLIFVKDKRAADLVIEVDHPLHVWDFTFLVKHRPTTVVLASGKVIAWDGIRAAPGIAKKIAKEFNRILKEAEPQLKRRNSETAEARQ